MCARRIIRVEKRNVHVLFRGTFTVPLSFGISKRTRAIGESRSGTRDRRASIRIKIDRVAREDSTSSTTEKNIKVSLGKMFLSLSINFLDLSPECRFPRVGRST